MTCNNKPVEMDFDKIRGKLLQILRIIKVRNNLNLVNEIEVNLVSLQATTIKTVSGLCVNKVVKFNRRHKLSTPTLPSTLPSTLTIYKVSTIADLREPNIEFSQAPKDGTSFMTYQLVLNQFLQTLRQNTLPLEPVSLTNPKESLSLLVAQAVMLTLS